MNISEQSLKLFMSMPQHLNMLGEAAKKIESSKVKLPPLFADAKVKITKQGTVVIGLECGELRDTGDTLFSRGKEKIAKAAALYAQHKWGQEAKALKEHERPEGQGL